MISITFDVGLATLLNPFGFSLCTRVNVVGEATGGLKGSSSGGGGSGRLSSSEGGGGGRESGFHDWPVKELKFLTAPS